MPHAIFDYMGAFLRDGFAHVDNVIPVIKTITWLLLSRLQGNKPHRNSPEPSEPQHTPELSGTFRNLPLEPTPAYAGTVRNLSPEPTPAYAGTLRNLPEPASGTYTAHTGALRNLSEPASGTYTAHTGALRNLSEPSSGTCSCDPHRHTPELIWAEDPISLRCWGKMRYLQVISTSNSWGYWLLKIRQEAPCFAANLKGIHLIGDFSKPVCATSATIKQPAVKAQH